MQIQINAPDIQLSDAIAAKVHEEVQHAMRVFQDQVTRVEVYLHDANAHKGGIDKRCVMEARLAGHQPLATEHATNDMYEAIRHAANKLERAVRHMLERHEEHKSSR